MRPYQKTWKYCEGCEAPIYDGMEYYDVNGVPYCMDCVIRTVASYDEPDVHIREAKWKEEYYERKYK